MLQSGLSEAIDDDEELARFLNSSRYFSKTIVKPAAFMPRPVTMDTSVFRHGAEPRAALWALAEQYVAGARKIHGAAIVIARDVRGAALDIVAAEPPPRHANIVGWPSSDVDPEMAKAEQKERAIRIAQYAEIVLPAPAA